MRKFLLVLLFFGGSCLFAQERIVSLANSLTNSIYLLNAGDRLVGCTDYCTKGVAAGVEIVGNAINVNVEKILSLRPDIVVAAGLTPSHALKAIEKFGIKTLRWKEAADFEELCLQFADLARHIGCSARADSIIACQKKRLEILRSGIAGNKDRKLCIQLGADPIFLALPGTFSGDYIVKSGCRNIAGDLKTGMTSREYVIIRKPDVIVISSMGIISANEKKEWMKYDIIPAVKSGKILEVDADRLCAPTPDVFVDVVEEILKIME